MLSSIRSFLKSNSPNVLSAAGCVGVVTTAYLAARGAHKAAQDLAHAGPRVSFKEDVKLVWKHYIPASVSGVVTIGSIIGANRIGNRRTIAAQALVAVGERAYSAYRQQVIEEYGDGKDQAIRDRVASKLVEENPPPAVMVAGSGDILAMEAHTGRYFSTTMERLKRAQNEVNRKLLIHDLVTLDEFYYEINQQVTSYSSEVGWRSPRLMELEFSSVIANEKPVLVFEYNYLEHL